MKRTSTDAEYLDSGKLVIDADGIPVDLGYRGVGFPEGKVSAPVGSIYTDTAATAGAIRWIKTTGDGNTGWQVEYGDTGWREIPLVAGTGRARVRRQNNVVSLNLDDWLNEGQYATHIVALPVGFVYSSLGAYVLAADKSWSGQASILGIYSSPHVSWLRRVDGSSQRPTGPQSSQMTFLTAQQWPTTLPGTPA